MALWRHKPGGDTAEDLDKPTSRWVLTWATHAMTSLQSHDDPERFRVELLFSPGVVKHPLLPGDHLHTAPLVPLHKNLTSAKLESTLNAGIGEACLRHVSRGLLRQGSSPEWGIVDHRVSTGLALARLGGARHAVVLLSCCCRDAVVLSLDLSLFPSLSLAAMLMCRYSPPTVISWKMRSPSRFGTSSSEPSFTYELETW